uniref:Uncharacterized protein n=1 Tax=Anguilla anguilla TaxID=7936 RepID=A0A0E9X8D0_ANGAN
METTALSKPRRRLNSDAKHVVVSFSHTRNLAKRKNAQDTQQGTNEKVTLLHHVSVCQRKGGSERLSIFIHRLVYTSSQACQFLLF